MDEKTIYKLFNEKLEFNKNKEDVYLFLVALIKKIGFQNELKTGKWGHILKKEHF